MTIERLAEGAELGGRYRIVEIVGRGGMGTVYRARDLRLDVDVAVKEMREKPGDEASHQAAVSQFEREAKLLAQLSHPNLPHVTDYFVEGDRWVLVMEYVPGVTAEQLLTDAGADRLPPLDVLHWCEQVADVLHYLHCQEPPIVFRDVKPANIMVLPDGTAKLVDFGIARQYRENGGKDTVSYGSPGYSPPEQYGRGQTDPRADIFALGATLYHLLTGDDPAAHPFKFAPLRRFDPSLPPAIEAIVAACVEPDEARRCPSAEVVRAVLADARAAVESPRPQVVTPSVPPPAPRILDTRTDRARGRRHPRWVLMVAAAVVLVAATTALVVLRMRTPASIERAHAPVGPWGAGTPPSSGTTTAASPLPVGSDTTLHVNTTPAGARVLLDGRQVGITPCEVRGIAAGSHQIRAVPPSSDLAALQWPIEAAPGATIALETAFTPRDPGAESAGPAVELISDAATESSAASRLHPGAPAASTLVSISLRATGLDGKTIATVVRFYDKASGRPVRPAGAGAASADGQGYLVAASQIAVTGNAVVFPAIELLVPREVFAAAPSRCTYEVTVYVDGQPVAVSARSPVTQ